MGLWTANHEFESAWGFCCSHCWIKFFGPLLEKVQHIALKLSLSRSTNSFNSFSLQRLHILWSSNFWQSSWTSKKIPITCSFSSFSLHNAYWNKICMQIYQKSISREPIILKHCSLDTSYLIGWCISDSSSRWPLLIISSKRSISFPCIWPIMYSAYNKGLVHHMGISV